MTPEPPPPAPLRPLPGHAGRAPGGRPALPFTPTVDDRRERILAATAELVGEQGYHATTLEQIVRRAHVGWPVFYKRFADKEAAFLALLDRAYAAVLDRAGAVVARGVEPWPRAVALALEEVLGAIAAAPRLARACLVDPLTAGPAAVERYERALRGAGELLRPGRALSPRAAELSATLEETLAGAVAWIAYQRLVAGEAELIPGLLAETLELLLLPYLGEEGTAKAVDLYGKHPHSQGTPA